MVEPNDATGPAAANGSKSYAEWQRNAFERHYSQMPSAIDAKDGAKISV